MHPPRTRDRLCLRGNDAPDHARRRVTRGALKPSASVQPSCARMKTPPQAAGSTTARGIESGKRRQGQSSIRPAMRIRRTRYLKHGKPITLAFVGCVADQHPEAAASRAAASAGTAQVQSGTSRAAPDHKVHRGRPHPIRTGDSPVSAPPRMTARYIRQARKPVRVGAGPHPLRSGPAPDRTRGRSACCASARVGYPTDNSARHP